MKVTHATQYAATNQSLNRATEQEPTQFANPSSINAFKRIRSLTLCVLSLSASVACSLAAPGDENWDDRFGRIGGGAVGAVALVGTNLYAGGNFELGTGRIVYSIGRWNGRIWVPLGTGVTNDTGVATGVATLRADGTNLYAGGNFTIAGGLTVNGIARWDGNNWFPLGGGVN